MSVLKRIQNKDRDAAKVLKEAGLCTDWDIQTVTREDLHELFPGHTNFKRRRNIYELIHKQSPIDDIIKEVKGFMPHDFFRAALTDNGVLVDYLRLLKDLRSQMTEVQGFFDAHINLLEGFRKDQPGSLSDTGTSDSMQTDDQPQDEQGSLSDPKTSDSMQTDDQPQDKQGSLSDPKTSDSVQTDDQPQDKQGSLSDTRTSDSVQTDDQPQDEQGSLSDTKTSDSVQTDDQPQDKQGSLSDSRTSDSVQTDDQPQDKQGSLSDPKTSDSVQTDDQPQDEQGSLSDTKTSDSVQTDDQPQDEQGESFIILSKQEVKYRTVVSGKTLGADKQLMEKVMKSKRQDWVQFVESSDDHMVNILFCPISSRIGSDIDAALSDVKDDKPVILVLMHHERQPKYVNAGIWTNKGNIVMYVNVYYHDTVHGLITCIENDNAISEIQKTLLKYSPQTCEESTRNAQGAGAESGRVGSTSFNDDRHSGNDSSSSVFSLSLPKISFRTSKKQN